MSLEGEQLLQKLTRQAAEREATLRALFEQSPERELYSRELADLYGWPMAHCQKLLRKLEHEGFLVSRIEFQATRRNRNPSVLLRRYYRLKSEKETVVCPSA
jgi:transcription initiation factor IIE alpha subunit